MAIDQKLINEYQRKRLVTLIREVSELHGGEPTHDPHTGEVLGDIFLAEYTAEVLRDWANDLQSAVKCFEDLKQQALDLKKYAPIKKESKVVTPSTGHGAFKEHYAKRSGSTE